MLEASLTVCFPVVLLLLLLVEEVLDERDEPFLPQDVSHDTLELEDRRCRNHASYSLFLHFLPNFNVRPSDSRSSSQLDASSVSLSSRLDGIQVRLGLDALYVREGDGVALFNYIYTQSYYRCFTFV